MPKAVIFDVDGTLIDTVYLQTECWVAALEHFGIAIPIGDMRLQIGKGGDHFLQGLIPPDTLDRRGGEMQSFRGDLFERDYMPRARPFSGVRELSERIRAEGQKAVLASSGTASEVDRNKEIAGVADLVDGATSSGDAERSKPFPHVFQAALAKLAPLSTAEAIVAGDTLYDAEAARKAGLKSLGGLCGGFPEGALRSAGYLAVFHHGPADLLERYAESPLAQPRA